MARPSPLMTVAVAAILAGTASGSAHADPYSQGSTPSSGKFEYGPYGSPGNPGSSGSSQPESYTYRGPNSAPPQESDDNASAGPPPEYRNTAPPAGNTGTAYGGGDRGYADPDADDERDDRAGGPPPQDQGPPVRDGREPYSGQAAGPPAGGYAVGLPRIEVRATAPDQKVPYEIREHDARQAAIEAWRHKVADQFGQQFADWRDAIGKRVDCHPDPREGLACIAGAQPVRGFDRYGQGRRDDR